MTLSTTNYALIIFGLFAVAIIVWSIRHHTRVIGYLASNLETPRMSWGIWSDRLLNGYWRRLPVRVRATYTNPTILSLTVLRPTSLREFDACMTGSGKLEFRSIQSGVFVIRTIARVSEDAMTNANEEDINADIVSYFNRTRVESVKVLLRELGWTRFHTSSNGFGVSMSGSIASSWNLGQARDHIEKTMTELQRLVS